MSDKALLVLEDGTVFAGRPFGATARAEDEVVFWNGLQRELKGMQIIEPRHRTMNGAAFEPPHPWRPEGLRYIGRAREGFALSEGRSGREGGGTHKRLPSEDMIGTRSGQQRTCRYFLSRQQFDSSPKPAAWEYARRDQ